MSLCNLTIQKLESWGYNRLTADCPVRDCGLPVARHRDEEIMEIIEKMSKVRECTACGQGFTEDNLEIGGRLTELRCQAGHEGPFHRITTVVPQVGKY